MREGFRHILPGGLDHVLFVLGVFLLSRRLRTVLVQLSAFTVAHSITFGLSMYGIVSLPPAIVEPAIALSIAYVAVENLTTSRLRSHRVALVFAFGLLHGLGFAGALSALALPRSQFLLALVGFNVGVEAGQIAVVALALAASAPWHRSPIRTGGSCWCRPHSPSPRSGSSGRSTPRRRVTRDARQRCRSGGEACS